MNQLQVECSSPRFPKQVLVNLTRGDLEPVFFSQSGVDRAIILITDSVGVFVSNKNISHKNAFNDKTRRSFILDEKLLQKCYVNE